MNSGGTCGFLVTTPQADPLMPSAPLPGQQVLPSVHSLTDRCFARFWCNLVAAHWYCPPVRPPKMPAQLSGTEYAAGIYQSICLRVLLWKQLPV